MNSRTPEEKYRDIPSRRNDDGESGDADGIREAAKEGASAARDAAEAQLEGGKTVASEAATSVARALDGAASSLSAENHESLARVTSTLAEQLSNLARSLEQRNVDELTRDARRLAREHPGLFVAGGIALGLAMGRFFRASGERQHKSHRDVEASDRAAEERWRSDGQGADGNQGFATKSAQPEDTANP